MLGLKVCSSTSHLGLSVLILITHYENQPLNPALNPVIQPHRNGVATLKTEKSCMGSDSEEQMP